MSFAKVVEDCHAQVEAKAARELKACLRTHGTPEQRDLGALQSLRARFAELSGAEFDRVLQEARRSNRGF